MKKGPIILFLFIVVIVLIAYFGKSFLFNERQKSTSDATEKTEVLNWAGDGYLGYAFLQSVEMKKQLARKGLALKFTNDNGDYETRLKKFAEKEYDFIVLPINSYIEHGAEYKFPGVIVAAISESKGADAIVGFKDVLPTGKINDLNNSDLIIYYSAKSPSSFLLDLTISDFDLDELQKNNDWRKEVGGSEEVYSMAKKAIKDRSVGDAFVMWEPEVTKAINNLGMKKLWGSDQFKGYIIDVFVFHRDIVSKHPEKIEDFLKTYFRVIDYYSTRSDERVKELSKIASIDKNEIENMIQNIDWYNIQENCTNLFEIPVAIGMPVKDGIINSIYACSNVMLRTGSINKDIDDPYLLVNSTFLESIKDDVLKSIGNNSNIDKIEFKSLDEKEWSSLSEIGTMRIEPITFQSGTSVLDFQGEEIVDKVAQMLINNYPNYRISIRGHTGQGEIEQNLILSKQRADIVKQRLIAIHGIDPNRLQSIGMGATLPPNKKIGENPRSYYLRWARVEFVLLEGSSI